MKLIKRFFKTLPQYLFIVSLLIQYPSANAQMPLDFINYYNDFAFLLVTNCEPNQYKNPMFLTLGFEDLSKIKMNDGKIIPLVGETRYHPYVFPKTKVIIHHVDVAIDKKDWDNSSDDDRFAVIAHEMMHAYFDYPDLTDEKYRMHFMFQSKEHLKRQDINIQLVDLLTILCHKQSGLSGSTSK